jgi:VanZ family protein
MRNVKRRINRFWVIGSIWALVLVVLSVIILPGPENVGVLWVDKVNHGVAYGALALLLIRACDVSFGSGARRITFPAVFAYSVFWGGMTELIQSFANGRAAELADFLADATGVLIVLALYWWAVPAGAVTPAKDSP